MECSSQPYANCSFHTINTKPNLPGSVFNLHLPLHPFAFLITSGCFDLLIIFLVAVFLILIPGYWIPLSCFPNQMQTQRRNLEYPPHNALDPVNIKALGNLSFYSDILSLTILCPRWHMKSEFNQSRLQEIGIDSIGRFTDDDWLS